MKTDDEIKCVCVQIERLCVGCVVLCSLSGSLIHAMHEEME